MNHMIINNLNVLIDNKLTRNYITKSG